MKLYTGVGGWGTNALAPNEKATNEESIIGVDTTQL